MIEKANIWFQDYRLEDLKANSEVNMLAHIGIEYTELGPDFLRGRMPVDARTRQPFGVLHGGASVVLAETLGSTASYLCIDSSRFYCVGLEVNANHLRGLRGGRVHAVARPVHLGRTTHVWDIRLSGDDGKPSCISRLTMAIVPLGEQPPKL
jgi:uncharacterized protein (TIGR00369 family)